ncbi:MAG: ABC transporter permease [Bacillales bacterium]|nr:ABC transporter permease [Bacillales bacterium]
MFTSLFGSVEAGVIYAIMALGVYISFRILDFPDLTVDGSFVTGGAIASVMIVSGINPFVATGCAFLAGFLAGCITGILHTKGKINPLLSGILMMTALYSINLRIMGKPNVPLLAEDTVITLISKWWNHLGIDQAISHWLELAGLGAYVPKTWGIFIIMLVLAYFMKKLIDWFMRTEIGLSIRAVGDNENMIKSFSANTDWLKVLGLGLSNAFVAFSGALIAQYNGFNDIGMGIGMIVIGLASVIIGEAIIGDKTIIRATSAVIVGAIIYRIIIGLALRIQFLDTGDMKLITAAIVVMALIIPQLIEKYRRHQMKKQRIQMRIMSATNRGETDAGIKSNL